MSIQRASSIFLLSALLIAGPATNARAADTVPPVPTFGDPASLTGPATIAFDEDVQNVTATNMRLRLSGTSTFYPVSLACTTATSLPADCMLGPLRKVTLRHDVVFVPGERYDILLNPSGASPITDTSSNVAATTTETFFGSATEQEGSLAATYVWRTFTASPALDGSYKAERVAGAYASFEFTGTGITWYTVMGPTQGWAVVGVDGTQVAKVNNYSSTWKYRVVRRYLGFAPGAHEITVRVLGNRGARRGDSWVAVDAFKTSTTNFDGEMAWPQVDAPSLRGGYARTSTQSSRVAFKFRARGIDWYTVTGPDQGSASVYIDGVRKATFDNYSPSLDYGVRHTITGLADRVHTATIVVTSTRGWVGIDAWSLKAPVTSFAKFGAWIDLFDYGSAAFRTAALDAMQAKGVRTVYLETSRYNSMTSFGDQDTDFTAAVKEWVDGAHARGMKIVGWYFPGYGSHLDTDLARTIAIFKLRTAGGGAFDGLAIDMEHGGGTSGATFNNGLAQHLHSVRLGIGPLFPIGAITPAPVAMTELTSSYNGFPWSSIKTDADVVMPMGYWSYRRSSPSQCSASVDTYCAYKYTKNNITLARSLTKLPVHEIGGVAVYTLNGSSHTIPNSDVTDFVKGAREVDAYGGSFYDYRTTASAWWSILAGLNNL